LLGNGSVNKFSPKGIAFNANRIWRRSYEINKQLQGLRIDVALFLETHLNPHERLYIVVYSAKKKEVSITCYKAKHIRKRKPILSSEN
jgi:hypothetical protein